MDARPPPFLAGGDRNGSSGAGEVRLQLNDLHGCVLAVNFTISRTRRGLRA